MMNIKVNGEIIKNVVGFELCRTHGLSDIIDKGSVIIYKGFYNGNYFEMKKGTKIISVPLPNNYVPVGKLAQKNIDGGIYLEPCLFSIKVPDVLKLHLDKIENAELQYFVL